MRVRSTLLLPLAAMLAWPAAADAKKITAYLTRTEPIKDAHIVYPTLAKAFPNDPDRCVAYTMGEWSRVKYAFAYDVRFEPTAAATGASPVEAFVTDDAPYQVILEPPAGKGVYIRRNAKPPSSLATSMGTLTWPTSVARESIAWYSTGAGCGDAAAVAQSRPFTVGKAVAKLSIPVQRIVQDDPPPKPVKQPPKGSVMQVVEIDKGKLWVTRKGKKHRLRFGDYLKVGDVVTVSKGGRAAIEMITGGRIGFAGGSSILILSESQVENVSEGKVGKALRKARGTWRLIHNRKEPLEIETAGGVMGIKG
jgi:hypothetical protein